MTFTHKRESYTKWDEYFMNIALLSASRSKDPNSQVGACIVNTDKIIIGTGYNGLPRGMDDDTFNWSRTNDYLDSKYPYVCHAEMNAISNCNQLLDLSNGILYTTLYPCNECTKLIIQKGIKKVVYLEHKYPKDKSFIASTKMLKDCKIEVIQYKGRILVS